MLTRDGKPYSREQVEDFQRWILAAFILGFVDMFWFMGFVNRTIFHSKITRRILHGVAAVSNAYVIYWFICVNSV